LINEKFTNTKSNTNHKNSPEIQNHKMHFSSTYMGMSNLFQWKATVQLNRYDYSHGFRCRGGGETQHYV